MDVPAFHQAKHLAGVTADVQRLAIKLARERIERGHDVRDRPVAVIVRVRRRRLLGFLPDARVGFLHHHLAEVDADQIVLKNVVIEHVFGCFAEVDDPFRQRRRLDAVGHVLRVDRAGGVVVAADAADAAGDEMRIPRVLVLHEDAVAAEDRRRAVALDDFLRVEVDLRVDAEAADDAGDRVPGHLDDVARWRGGLAGWCGYGIRHISIPVELAISRESFSCARSFFGS